MGRESRTSAGRIGIDTFGVFLHMGGSKPLPLTYVDNCAEAIVLAGLVEGVEGQVFNVVDDEQPTSGRFLRLYKRHVGRFLSIPVPSPVGVLCYVQPGRTMHQTLQGPAASEVQSTAMLSGMEGQPLLEREAQEHARLDTPGAA